MTPATMPHTTEILFAPEGWDSRTYGACESLPITRSGGVLYSYWRPTWRERLHVLFGRPVRLCVASANHPAVAVDTLS